jgi:hypothetical protein
MNPAMAAAQALGQLAPAWRTQLLRFHQYPAAYLHPQWRAAFPPLPPQAPLWQAEGAMAGLSAHILQVLQIECSWCFDAARPEWRLALLTPEQLERLARHVAATVLSARVRASLLRSEVLHWKGCLGDEAHQFALRAASLLAPVAAPHGQFDAASALALGAAWIEASLAAAPPALLLRARLKWAPADGALQGTVAAPGAAAALVGAILPAVEPQWCSAFDQRTH